MTNLPFELLLRFREILVGYIQPIKGPHLMEMDISPNDIEEK